MSNNTLFRLDTAESWCTRTHIFDQRMRGPVDFGSIEAAQYTLARELPRLQPYAGALLYMMSAALLGLPPGKPKKYFGFIDRVEITPGRVGCFRVIYTVQDRVLGLRLKTKQTETGPQLDLLVDFIE